MKCPNCRNEIHNSSLKCPYCGYVIVDDRAYPDYSTAPVYRRDNGYNGGGNNYYDHNNVYYGRNDQSYRGYVNNQFGGEGDYQNYYESKSKNDLNQAVLPILIFVLGLQVITLMIQIILLLQM